MSLSTGSRRFGPGETTTDSPFEKRNRNRTFLYGISIFFFFFVFPHNTKHDSASTRHPGGFSTSVWKTKWKKKKKKEDTSTRAFYYTDTIRACTQSHARTLARTHTSRSSSFSQPHFPPPPSPLPRITFRFNTKMHQKRKPPPHTYTQRAHVHSVPVSLPVFFFFYILSPRQPAGCERASSGSGPGTYDNAQHFFSLDMIIGGGGFILLMCFAVYAIWRASRAIIDARRGVIEEIISLARLEVRIEFGIG